MNGVLPPRLQALSAVLWRQRELLDLLLFKAEQERLLALAGVGRWQQRAARETRIVLEELVVAERERALAVARVAPLLDVARDAPVTAVAARCEESWAFVLGTSAAALGDASREALASRDVRRVLLRDGHEAARAVLLELACIDAGAGAALRPTLLDVSSPHATPEVDTAALAAALEAGATLIDVRQPEEYEEAHVPGARLLPLSELAARASQIPRDETVYVICASGGRSLAAAQALNDAGWQVVNVAGGTRQWVIEGRPFDTGSAR